MQTDINKSKVKRSKPPVINSLTGIRALGAWWVVIFHLKDELALLLPKDSPIIHFVNAGHIGVTLFFVLSGFILTYNYADTFKSLSGSKYLHFLGQRLARFYPVHIFTLVSLLLLIVTANVAGYSLGAPDRYTVSTFFQHIFLVNGWVLPINTSWNGVAWTLSVEWFCYLLFPILSVLWLKLRKPAVLIFITALILSTIPFIGPQGGIYEVIMFIVGVLLGKLYLTKFGAQFKWEIIVVGASIAIVFLGSAVSSSSLHTSVIAPFMVLFIYGLAWNEGTMNKLLGSKIMIYWGYTSYSLFMVHTIILLVLRNTIPIKGDLAQSPLVICAILLVYILTMAVISRLIYVFIEEPGRLWMKQKIKLFSQ